MNEKLLKDHRYFTDNRDGLVERYRGRHIVIAGCAVVGDYATEAEALAETVRTRKLGTFIVKKCIPLSEEVPIVFHSRVAFA